MRLNYTKIMTCTHLDYNNPTIVLQQINWDFGKFLYSIELWINSSSNFIPNRKQSTAYMSKDTSVNQHTLMFCWWSPEKPKAYLAGNQKSGRDRLSADAADQIHGFMNPREWPAQPSGGDRLHQRARQPPAVRTDPLEHNSLQVRAHNRQPQGPARVPHPQKGPSGPLPRIPRLCPLHLRTDSIITTNCFPKLMFISPELSCYPGYFWEPQWFGAPGNIQGKLDRYVWLVQLSQLVQNFGSKVTSHGSQHRNLSSPDSR